MKIRAIRLKEVGRFGAPVAIEGLSGGLDVLCGPNEAGKSTIFKAVKAALFWQHKSKKQEVELLRPYAGGAPLIEVDFDDIGGRPWRIRKQFLSAPSAELRDLRNGSLARGGDAEARLAELLSGAGRFALLWVEQKASLAPVSPVATAGGSLVAAIESEVESVADGGAARFVAERVKAQLAELVTSHNPPRPTGAYKAALDERLTLRRQCEEAEARFAAAQGRLDRLGEVRIRLTALSGPEAEQRRSKAAAQAKRAFEEAQAAREQCRHVEEAVRGHEERLVALKSALAALDGRASDLSKLEDAIRNDGSMLGDLQLRVKDSGARAGECKRLHDEIKAALAAAERERRALELAERLDQVTQRLDAARAATGERAAHSAALAGNGADEAIVSAARREAKSIALLEARLSAAAPRVSVAYVAGGTGKIMVDGRPLSDGEVLNPTRPLAIDIAGIGTITIAPGHADSLAEDSADLVAHTEQLSALLARAGAASLEEAEQRLADRRVLEARLAEAIVQLKTLAPEGIERLERAHAELSAQAAAFGGIQGENTQAEIETRALELTVALAEAEMKLAEAQRADTEVREQLVQLHARIDGHSAQIKVLADELGAPDVRQRERETRLAAVAAAEGARNTAVRDLTAWREKAPADTRFAELKEAAEAAVRAEAGAEKELAELRRSEAGIEGELKADRADDVAARVAELNDRRAAAEARCLDAEEEIRALQLLVREVEAAASQTRDRFAKPVMQRLDPYLQLVFPEARLGFGDGLTPQALQRTEVAEDIVRLSDGTQEQLAVLVRLALAQLLAETGSPAPLILDDALVYADDHRIARVFEALRLAARTHQVLVLTCRERAFAGLGGHRVAIGAWEEDSPRSRLVAV